jgi:hypothetical protein
MIRHSSSNKISRAFVAVLTLGLAVSCGGPGLAADMVLKAPKKAPPPPSWWDTLTITGHVEAGITGNAANPSDGINFGHLSRIGPMNPC